MPSSSAIQVLVQEIADTPGHGRGLAASSI
jgi:hypothetical protein